MRFNKLLSMITATPIIFISASPGWVNAQSAKTTSNKADCLRVRAGFDIGSNTTKMKVFQIDACQGTLVKQIYPEKGNEAQSCESKSNLPFKKDLDNSVEEAKEKAAAGKTVNWKNIPHFSPDLIGLGDGVESVDPCDGNKKKIVNAKDELTRLVNIAKTYHPDDIVGVATEAFRESTNSDYIVDYLGRTLGMRLLVPSGEQEALIEWMSTTIELKTKSKSSFNPDNIVTLGIGNGSMQIATKATDGSFAAFPSTLAADNIYNYAVENVRGSDKLLPFSHDEIRQIIKFASDEASHASPKVKERMGGFGSNDVSIFGVGGVINKAVAPAVGSILGRQRSWITTDDINDLLAALEGKSSEDPVFKPIGTEYRQALIPNAALVLGVMSQLGIQKIYTTGVDNTLGALFTKDFGIKMTYKKPVVASAAVTAAQQGKSASVADSVESSRQAAAQAAPLAASVDNSENEATCQSAPKKIYNPGSGVCTIQEPCLNFTDFCSNKATAVKDGICKVSGKPLVTYPMCKNG